jgi:hypothetical protein
MTPSFDARLSAAYSKELCRSKILLPKKLKHRCGEQRCFVLDTDFAIVKISAFLGNFK